MVHEDVRGLVVVEVVVAAAERTRRMVVRTPVLKWLVVGYVAAPLFFLRQVRWAEPIGAPRRTSPKTHRRGRENGTSAHPGLSTWPRPRKGKIIKKEIRENK